MRKLSTKNSIKMEFFSKQTELENYARVGKIAHELFHDLLNPITGFMLYVNFINQNQIKDQEIKKQFRQIIESVYRIKRFIRLVQKSIVNPHRRTKLDLNRSIREIMSLSYYRAKKQNVSIVLISRQKIKIRIEKIKLYQILINLLSNAIDAYEQIDDDRKRQIIIKTNLLKNKMIISVSDNGCGIEQKNLKKIFEPNYTTKSSGFGIGLKTINKIIQQELKGKITVKSTPQIGTIFKIIIPKNH